MNSLCLLPKPALSPTISGNLGGESLSRVRLCDAMDDTVHGILQAGILECVAVPFFTGSSRPRDGTQVSCTAGGFFTRWATREAQGKPSQKGNLGVNPAVNGPKRSYRGDKRSETRLRWRETHHIYHKSCTNRQTVVRKLYFN